MANKRIMVTLKRAVLVRLVTLAAGRAEQTRTDFNVTVTHLVGVCVGSERDGKTGKETKVVLRVSEVAWDKDAPKFYKLGNAHGLVGPAGETTDVTLPADTIAAIQNLE